MDSIEAMILEPILRIFFGSLVQTRAALQRKKIIEFALPQSAALDNRLHKPIARASEVEQQRRGTDGGQQQRTLTLKLSPASYSSQPSFEERALHVYRPELGLCAAPFSRPGRRVSLLSPLSRHRTLRCMAARLLVLHCRIAWLSCCRAAVP